MDCPLCKKVGRTAQMELTRTRLSADRTARFRKYACPICGSKYLTTEEMEKAEVLEVGKKHVNRLLYAP